LRIIATFAENGHTKMEISLTKERIKDLISQKGVSYAAFAQKLGIKRQNLDAYLDAQKKDINLVIKMADVLGMSLYEFIGMPEPDAKDVYGCLYVKGRPVLVNSKEELLELVRRLENE
jgi:transcriptional regulator with XRE-family HTH domain